MAHFFRLRGRMDDVARSYFKMTQDASDNLACENAAVISVQSFYRATRVRNTWHATQNGAMLIQRVIRGWLGRARARALRRSRNRRLYSLFFEHCASVIQRFYRGFRSRRLFHNFHGRRKYLDRIEQRGEYTKDWLHDFQRQQVIANKREEEVRTREEFDNLASNLHHLMSTKAAPGVYNPPYSDLLPQAFGKPIEQHLRDSCKVVLPKSLRRPRHKSVTRERPSPKAQPCGGVGPPQDLPSQLPHHSRSASVGRMQRIQGPFRSREQLEVCNAKAANMYRTIQAAAPYGIVQEEQNMSRRLDKLTRVSAMDFVAPGECPLGTAPSSVHIGLPHIEKPAGLRGDYTQLPKIRDKPPFFTALPRDRDCAEYNEHLFIPSGHV